MLGGVKTFTVSLGDNQRYKRAGEKKVKVVCSCFLEPQVFIKCQLKQDAILITATLYSCCSSPPSLSFPMNTHNSQDKLFSICLSLRDK